MSTDGQGTKWHRNIAEYFSRLSRVHERYRRQRTGDDSSRSLIKQIKRSDMVTFLFAVHTIAVRGKAIDRAVHLSARSFDLARPGVAQPPLVTPSSLV